MFAPAMTYRGTDTWHKVNPLHLAHPVCSLFVVLNCNRVTDEVPNGARLCKKCQRVGDQQIRTPNEDR